MRALNTLGLMHLTLLIGLLVASPVRGAISIDANVTNNQGTPSTSVRTAAFSTTAGNELLLAFIATDSVASPNTTVISVAGAGLTWVLVQRTNAQLGTSEIWRAFSTSPLTSVTVTATLSQSVDSSLTVMSFNGVNTSGTNGSGAIGGVKSANAPSGAPTATLVTLGSGSLVLGVGNDWDKAIARTPGTGQSVLHQYLAPVGDTYWVQMQNSPILLSGTSVTINDTAPTGDRYNLSIVEVLAAAGGGTSGSISGTVTPSGSGNGATVTLSQGGTTVATTTVTSGSYNFSSVTNGTYTVTPTETGFTFNPASQSVTVNGNAATVPAFTATAVTYTVSGTITPIAAGTGTTVTLSQNGATVATASANSSGTYSFANIANGTYTVTPANSAYTFNPVSQSVTVNGANANVPVFNATAVPTFTVSGTISPTTAGTGTTVTLSQNGTTAATTSANSSGTYSFASIANGTYTVTPANSAFNFNPTSQSVTVSGVNASVPVFNALPTGTAAQHVQSCTPSSVGGFGIPTFTTITCNNVGANLLAVGVAYECCNHLSDMTVSDGQNAFVATPAGKPNPGTSVPSCFANGGNQVASVFYHSYASAPGKVTITVTLQANEAITLFADEFSGVSTFDVDACGTSNTGTTINTPTITPSGANEVQYAACAAGGNVPAGGTTPWTQVTTGVDAEWLITTGAISQAPVFGAQTGGLGWACLNAAFKSSGGGGTGTTGSITGTISPAAAGTGTTVTLSKNGTVVATIAATSSGTYTFSNVTNGTYTVTPTATGFTFNPASQSVTVNGNTVTVPAFTATALSGSISGTITPPANGNGAVVTLSQGATTVATTTVASGSYTFNSVTNGTYTVTPSETGFTFNPTSQSVIVNGNAATVPVFTVTPPPDLTIIKSHSGNFFQGQTGATYTITVTNSGGAGTSGTVTVTDTLPASLTPTAMSGTGWTCTLATLTCTRGDTLAAAASYPAITLTVNVASNAPGSVTNTATVSGGGETNTSNDTANDLTTVTAGGGALIHVGGASGHPVVTNQIMTFNYTPVATNDALVVLVGCRSSGVTSMSLTAPGWAFTPISGLVGPSSFFDFISTFGAITPNTAPVTFTVTLTGGNGSCTSNDTTVLADEFSGNDLTGGTTTFDAHGESLDPAAGGICTGAPVIPANNNDAIWYACFDNVTGVGGGYVKGQDDTTGDWSEYKILSGGSGVVQSPSFATNPNFSSFGLGGVSIKAAASGVSVPDLTVSKTHSGSFTQGQTGASYSITVTNSGGAATSGTVTMTDTLPAALTPTAIGGTGWTCTLGTLTCTRSDALAAVASYPAITLTVNVAGNAPGSVTNTATVSGGGETNTSNDTANDSTVVNPAGGASTILFDVNVSKDQSPASRTVATPAFSTVSGNELLLAFVGADYQPSQSATNVSVTGISGGGLTWVLVERTNAQAGTAEIWRAFSPSVLSNVTVTATLSQSVQSSISVLSFAGVDTTGTNGSGAIGAIGSANASSGAPTATLVTTRNNSWVFGAGNDYDNAIARTPGSGQKLVHQDLAPINDTYWVQMQNAATPLSGTSVTINDTAPTSDRYNLSTVEVLPSLGSGGGTTTFGISGSITPAANGAGATVSLSGTVSAGATADSNGNYAFSGLANGSYAITPAKSGFAFAPPNQNVTLSGANLTSVNFTAQPVASSGIKLVQANTNGNESGTANMSVTFPVSNTAGNFLIVTGSAARPASNLSVSDSLGNSYSVAIGPVTDTTQNVTLYIWYVPACKGGANTVTIVPSGTAALEIHVSEWSGLATTSPLDVTSFATGTGTSVSSGSKTTTSNGELIFGYGWVFNTAAAGSGFTAISLVNGDLDEYQIQTFAGNAAATFTQASGTWGAVMATFKSQASVTGPNVSMTSPAPNAIVTANSTVSATASDMSSSITGVQFQLDGSNLGVRVTAPPYSLTWNTTTATAGVHTLSATVFDSAGLSANAAPISITVDNSGNAAIVGSWAAPVTIPTVAVNLLLLNNNTLMFYEDGGTATVWDYVANKFTSVPTSTDLFCSGHALMTDGRVLAVGGYGQSSATLGIANAEIFDPSSNSWTGVPPMAFQRWYPTATTLSDGRILVTAGWQTTNHTNAGIPEIYDPVANTWTSLTNANNPFETYPFMFLLSDGRIIHTGGTEVATNTDILDINAQTWTVLDSRIVDGGSATMYSPGKILKAGSASDSQSTGPSSNTAFLLDTTQPSPAWQQVPSMAYPRSFLNLTTLPDGTVLATGGETDKNGGNINNAVYAAELWSPQTQTWTTMASMHTPREYHSTALLLPDGRVVESGMGADFGNITDEKSAEFYSPPYLFKGTRPTISQAPAQISYAQNFFVGTPDGATIASAVLIRTGATTHFFDQNTRYVPVAFQQTAGGLTVTAPANGNQAPPGYYMLFLVNANGVPSLAPFLQLH